ncbi:hypothetical protein LWI29_005155 [Acer saccharum]|uniref:Uncharacterized protein n=1 Tax=Acer saccharum TaxID=4024 RepID=A0AA39S2M5_ACESA|nr:hypothetical protein LWI29_005155 [Acer saccharum]KAK1562669.1 hypothetical protein Q3G72_015560 [Acer saccharum]
MSLLVFRWEWHLASMPNAVEIFSSGTLTTDRVVIFIPKIVNKTIATCVLLLSLGSSCRPGKTLSSKKEDRLVSLKTEDLRLDKLDGTTADLDQTFAFLTVSDGYGSLPAAKHCTNLAEGGANVAAIADDVFVIRLATVLGFSPKF